MKPQIVEIDWVDINSGNGSWTRTPKIELVECSSAGYLLHSCKKIVSVLQTACRDGAYTDTITIPRYNIVRIRRLGATKLFVPPTTLTCPFCKPRKKAAK